MVAACSAELERSRAESERRQERKARERERAEQRRRDEEAGCMWGFAEDAFEDDDDDEYNNADGVGQVRGW